MGDLEAAQEPEGDAAPAVNPIPFAFPVNTPLPFDPAKFADAPVQESISIQPQTNLTGKHADPVVSVPGRIALPELPVEARVASIHALNIASVPMLEGQPVGEVTPERPTSMPITNASPKEGPATFVKGLTNLKADALMVGASVAGLETMGPIDIEAFQSPLMSVPLTRQPLRVAPGAPAQAPVPAPELGAVKLPDAKPVASAPTVTAPESISTPVQVISEEMQAVAPKQFEETPVPTTSSKVESAPTAQPSMTTSVGQMPKPEVVTAQLDYVETGEVASAPKQSGDPTLTTMAQPVAAKTTVANPLPSVAIQEATTAPAPVQQAVVQMAAPATNVAETQPEGTPIEVPGSPEARETTNQPVADKQGITNSPKSDFVPAVKPQEPSMLLVEETTETEVNPVLARESAVETPVTPQGTQQPQTVRENQEVRPAELFTEADRAQEATRQILKRVEEVREVRPPMNLVIRLNPEEWGTVTLAFRSSGNGSAEATVQTSNPHLAAALESAKPQLMQTVESKGVQLSQLNLQLQPDAQSQGQGHGQPTQTPEDVQRFARLAEATQVSTIPSVAASVASTDHLDVRI